MAELDERWGAGAQQDAQEFLVALLQVLQAECNRVPGRPKYRELAGAGPEAEQAAAAAAYAREWHDSFVDDVFGGLLQSTVRCVDCGHESHCFDACCDLSVPIPDGAAAGRGVTLCDCLAKFSETELLDAKYTCTGCKAETAKTKHVRLYTPPPVLIVTLKRFAGSRGLGGAGGFAAGGLFGRATSFTRMRKNTTPVDVPAAIDIAPFCNDAGRRAAGASARYELLAVSEHSGSLGGGHYTATGRAVSDNQWHAPAPDDDLDALRALVAHVPLPWRAHRRSSYLRAC